MLTGLLRYRKVEEVTAAKDEPTPGFCHSYCIASSKTAL